MASQMHFGMAQIPESYRARLEGYTDLEKDVIMVLTQLATDIRIGHKQQASLTSEPVVESNVAVEEPLATNGESGHKTKQFPTPEDSETESGVEQEEGGGEQEEREVEQEQGGVERPESGVESATYSALLTRALNESANGQLKVSDFYRILRVYNPSLVTRLLSKYEDNEVEAERVFQSNIRQNLTRSVDFRSVTILVGAKKVGVWEIVPENERVAKTPKPPKAAASSSSQGASLSGAAPSSKKKRKQQPPDSNTPAAGPSKVSKKAKR